MMKTYRLGVFETNSSSSHSLILNREAEDSEYRCRSLNLYKFDVNGPLILNGGQYGWEWERLTTAWSKANYIATWLSVFKPNDYHLIDVLRNAIKTELEGIDVIVDICTDYSSDNWCYVDHEAEYLFDDSNLSDENYMREFIFDVRNIIVTGNDNELTPCGIRDPLGTKYKWKLIFPDLEKYKRLYDEYTTKLEWYFTELPTDSELEIAIGRILDPYNYDKNGIPCKEFDDYKYGYVGKDLYSVVYTGMAKKLKLRLLDRESMTFRLYRVTFTDGYKVIEDDFIDIKFKMEEGDYELY